MRAHRLGLAGPAFLLSILCAPGLGTTPAHVDSDRLIVRWNKGSGQNYLWLMNGMTVASQGFLPSVGGSNWMPAR